jgi:hypothetical protein
MNKRLKFACIGMAAVLLASPCFPQNAENKPDEQAKYFRLDFTVKELEGGKVLNARSYSTNLSNQKDVSSIRAGDKVPVQSEKGQWTYIDIGVSIDCRNLKQVDNQVVVNVTADISGVGSDVPASASDGSASRNPVIRQIKWSSTVSVPLRKPVTIFSSDGVSTKRQTQLELIATPAP